MMKRPGTVGSGVNTEDRRLDAVGLAVLVGTVPERFGSKQRLAVDHLA